MIKAICSCFALPRKVSHRPAAWLRCLLLLLASSCSFGVCNAADEQEPADDDGSRRLKVVEQAYLDNRECFRAFTCRFRVLEGKAQNKADALDGRLTDVILKSGLWICDGGDGRYELLCDKEPVPQPPTAPMASSKAGTSSGRMTEVDCLSITQLYSRQREICVGYSRTFGQAVLEAGGSFTGVITPISMGVMGRGEKWSPAETIRAARRGERYCRYVGTDIVEGVPVDVIEAGTKASPDGAPVFTWYLDVQRGCVPLRTVCKSRDGSVSSETTAEAIRRCENGGFVCERTVSLSKTAQGFFVTIIELASLDLSKPSRDSLALSLPAETKVVDAADRRSTFRLRNAETFRLDDIDIWAQRCREFLRQTIDRQNAARSR